MTVGKEDLLDYPAIFPDKLKKLPGLCTRIDQKPVLGLIVNIKITVFFKISLNRYFYYHRFTLYDIRPARSSYPAGSAWILHLSEPF